MRRCQAAKHRAVQCRCVKCKCKCLWLKGGLKEDLRALRCAPSTPKCQPATPLSVMLFFFPCITSTSTSPHLIQPSSPGVFFPSSSSSFVWISKQPATTARFAHIARSLRCATSMIPTLASAIHEPTRVCQKQCRYHVPRYHVRTEMGRGYRPLPCLPRRLLSLLGSSQVSTSTRPSPLRSPMAPPPQPWTSWTLHRQEAPISDWAGASMPPIAAHKRYPPSTLEALPAPSHPPPPPQLRYPQPLKMRI